MRPKLLDLFCGAGGAAMGYHLAGFDVIGVDIAPQPNYPFEFHQADALDVLLALIVDPDVPDWLAHIAMLHLSPPCQAYSTTKSLHAAEYPKLIGPVRDIATLIGLPFVIENVAGARSAMRVPVTLCGSSFGLGVRRHRLFEVHPPLAVLAPPCAHYLQPEPIDVTGTGGPRRYGSGRRPDGGGGNSRKPENLAHARQVMGIDWMSRTELAESVPPAFTEFLGVQLVAHLASAAA